MSKMEISLLIGIIVVGNGFCELSDEENSMVPYWLLKDPYPNAVDRDRPIIRTVFGDNQYYENFVGSPDQNWDEIYNDVNFVGMQPNEQWEVGLQPQIPENSRSFLDNGLFGVNRFGKTPFKHNPHRLISPPHSSSYSSNHGASGIHSHSDGYGSHSNIYGTHGNGHGSSHVNPYQSYGSSHKHGHGHGSSYGSSHGHVSGFGISQGNGHFSKPQNGYSQIYELSHGIPYYKKKSHGLHDSKHHGSHKRLYNSHSKFRSNDEMEETMMPSNIEFDHTEFRDVNQIFR